MTKKLILDLDLGIDDAMALAYALGSPEVELLGVMTSFGNARVETTTRNCLAVLDLLGHPEIPVYIGSDRALAAGSSYIPSVGTMHAQGKNGIGEASIPDSPYAAIGGSKAGENAAVAFLLDSARAYGRDVIYVATGPMTNLARAIECDREAVSGIGRIVVMGGALTVPGNVSAGAEANVADDPEAADALLRSGIRVLMVGLDATHQVVLCKKQTDIWRGSGTMAACAFASMVDYYIDAYAASMPQLGGCALHDPLAVACAIDPTLVGALPINLRVDLLGEFRGRTIGDPERIGDAPVTTMVALTVDKQRFYDEFTQRVGRALA